MDDTIFAVSSGRPPAAIAIVRISGSQAHAALRALVGRVPPPRRASTRTLRDASGDVLDYALTLWLPGPATATGEDVAELHCHGGRAVVAAVECALAAVPGLRPATPGEFTRRAFVNGRIDLAEAEGLADLLAAETELHRRSAMAMAGGAVSQTVAAWRAELLRLSAQVEAALDFADDDELELLPVGLRDECEILRGEIAGWLVRPRAEVLRDGVRVVIAGPPNAGKSTLFNALVDGEAAITAPTAGTTRDVLTRAVALDGVPFTFVDTAGLREAAGDPVEAIGIARARDAVVTAALVLWLGADEERPQDAWLIEAQVDRAEHVAATRPRHRVSTVTGIGMTALRRDLVATARTLLPMPGDAALGERQHDLLARAAAALARIADENDALLIAEHQRAARLAFDELVGRSGTEDMLDALFGGFCIGK